MNSWPTISVLSLGAKWRATAVWRLAEFEATPPEHEQRRQWEIAESARMYAGAVRLLQSVARLADDVLEVFPKERENDLLIIDLGDPECIIPFDLLAWNSQTERDLVCDETLEQILRMYPDPGITGPIFESTFSAFFRLAMALPPGDPHALTLAEFNLLFSKEPLRDFLLNKLGESEIRDNLEEALRVRGEGQLSNLAPYVTNKLARWLRDRQLRLMFGHGGTALDFDELVSGARVWIVKLARGKVGNLVSDLVAAQILSRLRLALMRQGATQRESGPFLGLYIDECGTMSRDENLSRLLSEARKYNAGVVLGTQYADQLRRPGAGSDNLSGVLGNVGTTIALRLGAEDAPRMAQVFAPVFSASDLIEAPNFNGFVRTTFDGRACRPFSIRLSPPQSDPNVSLRQRLTEANRRRYGVTSDECQRRIAERRKWIDSL